jgi:hypothetical protein
MLQFSYRFRIRLIGLRKRGRMSVHIPVHTVQGPMPPKDPAFIYIHPVLMHVRPRPCVR